MVVTACARLRCVRLVPCVSFLLLLHVVYLAASATAFFRNGGQGSAQPPAEQSEEEVDYYEVLGLTEEATDKEVRQKYRELSRKYHPDVNRAEDSRVRYSKIVRANDVLTNKKKRRMYDMRGEEGLRKLEQAEAKGDQESTLSPLAQLFGMGGGNKFRGSDSEVKLQIDLEDVYKGGQKMLSFNKQRVCRKCKGSGSAKGSEVITCTQCKGHGAVIKRIQLAPGMYQQVQHACPHCQGHGRMAKHKCSACNGNKLLRADVTLSVDIEQGIPEGHTLKFEMESDESLDAIPGDLILSLSTKPHPRFARRSNGFDLDTTLTVTLSEALLGFERRVPHLDGTDVIVRATDVTQYGSVLKVTGKGMPRHNKPSERGDLYVKVLFELPSKLTVAQKKEIEDIF